MLNQRQRIGEINQQLYSQVRDNIATFELKLKETIQTARKECSKQYHEAINKIMESHEVKDTSALFMNIDNFWFVIHTFVNRNITKSLSSNLQDHCWKNWNLSTNLMSCICSISGKSARKLNDCFSNYKDCIRFSAEIRY